MPDESTHLHLPYIAANQAQKHVTHNEAVRLLDALVQMSVKSRTLTAPPGSPTDGDRYIVASGATGAWAAWDLNIAYYVDGAWMKLVPQTGWLAWIEAEQAHVRWNGTAWEATSGNAIEVQVNFASPSRGQFFDVAVPRAVLGQKVLVAPSLNMPSGVAEDELEMDPLVAFGHVKTAGQVRLFVGSAQGGVLGGPRTINLILS